MAKNKPKPIAKLTATEAISIKLSRNEMKALMQVLAQDRILVNFLDKMHLHISMAVSKRIFLKMVNNNGQAMTMSLSKAEAAAICHIGCCLYDHLSSYESAVINKLYLELDRFLI